jgi:hypothetical protein
MSKHKSKKRFEEKHIHHNKYEKFSKAKDPSVIEQETKRLTEELKEKQERRMGGGGFFYFNTRRYYNDFSIAQDNNRERGLIRNLFSNSYK